MEEFDISEFQPIEGALQRTRYDWNAALEYIKEHKAATVKEIQEIVGASQARVRGWLNKMVEKGVLVRGIYKNVLVYVDKEFYESQQ